MRSRLLYVVPLVLTAGSAWSQQYISNPGPGYPYSNPSQYMPYADSLVAPVVIAYPRPQQIYVNTGTQIIVNNGYPPIKPRVKKRVIKPRPPCNCN